MGRSPSDVGKARGGVLALGVAVAHLALFAALGLSASAPAPFAPPAFEVELFRPPIPIPEPPAPVVEPARTTGGGAPAAPSRVHVPPVPPPDTPREPPAPPVPAPEPSIVVGLSPQPAETPGMGQGGQGTGEGGGTGSGVGPGAGFVGPRILRGPTLADLRREHPPAALRARRSGEAAINCEIRLDTRLDDCRLVREGPEGEGFGRAALATAAYFRFQPPAVDGRPQSGQRVTFNVEFGRSGAR